LPLDQEYQEKGEKITRESRASIGYWLDGRGFAWIKETTSGTAYGVEPLDLARARDRARDRAIFNTRVHARDLARAIGNTLTSTNSMIVVRNYNLYPLITVTASLFIRALVLAVALNATFKPSPKKGILPSTKRILLHFSKKRQPVFLPGKSSLEIGLDIFESFQLLELRMQGTLSPCEGILIVKEKKDTPS
jgi:hypothetical protein